MKSANIKYDSPSPKDDNLNRRISKLFLAGIFLVSFSLLSLEISLTRVLSVMFSYHYVFVVISLALLGLGLGAIFISRGKQSSRHGDFRSLATFASLLSVSIPLSLIVMVRIAGVASEDGILLFIPLLFAPFFFGGVLLARLFRLFPALSAKFYGMDLLGAATGSLAVVFILNMIGGSKTIVVISIVALIAAILFAIKAFGVNARKLMKSVSGLLIIFSLLGTVLVGSNLAGVPIGKSQDKEIGDSLSELSLGAEIVETKWSAFGRTDLVALRNEPDQMLLFIDGTAGTPMFQFSGDISDPSPSIQSLKTEFPGYLSLANLQPKEKDAALIIGPGGGRDVLLALLAGVNKITAVEVNKDLVDIVRKYSWYNGGIYDLNNVSVVVDEGRNFLKRQQEKYDIIMLSLPVTKTSRSVEGYALTENFLFTTESISDYMEHLSDEGQLVVVTHDPSEILKLLSISLEALSQNGIDKKSVMKYIYVIGSHHFPVFVIKKTPFKANELVPVHQSIHQLGYDPTSSYLPTIKLGSCTPHESEVRFNECGMLNPALVALNQGDISINDLTSAFKKRGLDLSVTTDDSPFFYKFEEGMPQSVSIIFWSSALILLSLMMIPLRRRKTSPDREMRRGYDASLDRKLLRFLVLFAMLGAGFMLVEISIFQRFILFLGQPVLSLAVLLSSLLVGGAIGSLCSSRFTGRVARVMGIVSLVIVAVLLIYAFATPLVFRQFLGEGLTARLMVAVVTITPLGFLMGFPFPMGLRLLKDNNMEDYIPWMWGVNGVSSVFGSATTIVVAITLGFTSALLAGAACYLIVFLLSLAAKPGEFPNEKLVSDKHQLEDLNRAL